MLRYWVRTVISTHHETEQPALDVVRAALKESRSCQVVLHNQRKDGRLFVNELSLAPVFDGQGQVTHFVGQQSDISLRLKVESELTKMESKVVLGSKAGSTGLLELDPGNGGHQVVSRGFQGLSSQSGPGRASFEELVHIHTPESKQLLSVAIEEALRLGKPYHLDIEILAGGGPTGFVPTGRRFVTPRAGPPSWWGRSWISDLKNTQQALALREAEIKTCSTRCPTCCSRVNGQGLLQDCRPPALVQQHLQSEDWLGHTVFALFPPEVGPQIRGALDRVLKGASVQVVEFQRPGVGARLDPILRFVSPLSIISRPWRWCVTSARSKRPSVNWRRRVFEPKRRPGLKPNFWPT